MNKLYVIQFSTNKGENWKNVIINGVVAAFDIKPDAKSSMEEIYQYFKQVFKRMDIKPIARKWYRIKEFVEESEVK